MTNSKAARGRGAPVEIELQVSYEPDEERALRGLGILLGFPLEEIERVVSEWREAESTKREAMKK